LIGGLKKLRIKMFVQYKKQRNKKPLEMEKR